MFVTVTAIHDENGNVIDFNHNYHYMKEKYPNKDLYQHYLIVGINTRVTVMEALNLDLNNTPYLCGQLIKKFD